MYTKTIPSVSIDGVDLPGTVASSLFLNEIDFVCDFNEDGVEFTVRDHNQRHIDAFVRQLDSMLDTQL